MSSMEKSIDPQYLLVKVENRLLALYREVRDQTSSPNPSGIMAQLSEIREMVRLGGTPSVVDAYNRFLDLISIRVSEASELASLRLKNLDLRSLNEQSYSGDVSINPLVDTARVRRLHRIVEQGLPGISLVTCCMNRNENLLKVLPSWLRHSEITEIVIVDWTSTVPISEDLAQHGIRDSRIRVVRVDGEPRWILSYAYNAGFRVARYNQILKVDADIVIEENFFDRNVLEEGTFIAGNWRTSSPDQVYTNGFFFTTRAGLYSVSGFNEFITTYGWDDDDIYHRMVLAGFRRVDVADKCIYHLDHSDEKRLGEITLQAVPKSAVETISTGTDYMIRRNRYIAHVMPSWRKDSTHVGFEITTSEDGILRLVRDKWVPSTVPPHVDKQADFIALWEIASWRLGDRIRMLGELALRKLLQKPLEQITPLDIELAALTPSRASQLEGPYCVLRIPDLVCEMPGTEAHKKQMHSLSLLKSQLRNVGLQLIVQAPFATWPKTHLKTVRDLPLIPSWQSIGDLPAVTLDQAIESELGTQENMLVKMTYSALCMQASAHAPAVMIPKPKFYIDAQHGLGNRLRAIGSAASIAEATDRELVIIWEPDHHCDCRFEDLFDYEGALIETGFIHEATSRGCDVYNYMTAEPNARKNAPLILDRSREIYARAAFVLNSEFSDWSADNVFIRSLVPVDAISDLVASTRAPNDVTAHIRMEGGKKYEHLPYESPKNWTKKDHDLIAEWRAKSHFERFMKRLDQLITEGRAGQIFLAADRPETYDAFTERYGSRVAFLPRTTYDRSTEQLQYAVADALLLSRAPLMLGSTWSSFSELALRLAADGIQVEMSGQDF